MTFENASSQFSKESLTVVELNFDTKVSADGKEYHCDGLVPLGQKFYPSIQAIKFSPSRLNITGGLSYVGSCSVTFQDFPHPEGGTYFGRLLGSNNYWLERELFVYDGYIADGFDFDNFQKRAYFIKKITGPDQRGRVTVRAEDVLSRLGKDDAVWPKESPGKLVSGITSTQTGLIDVDDTTNLDDPSAIYSYALIDDEIIEVSNVTSDQITINSRGFLGTTPADHAAETRVKVIYHEPKGLLVTCLARYLSDGANVPAIYLDVFQWIGEAVNYLSSDEIEVTITKPTKVKKLIEQLSKQTYMSVYWDDIEQKVKILAVGPRFEPPKTLNQKNLLSNKEIISKDQEAALNQVWFYYGLRDVTESQDEEDNFKNVYIFSDLVAEAGLGKPKRTIIYGNHAQTEGTAIRVSDRYLKQFRSGQIEMKFQLEARDASNINLGDSVSIYSDRDQDENGLGTSKIYLITEKEKIGLGIYEFLASFLGVDQNLNYCLIAPNGLPDYLSATEDQTEKYCYLAGTATEKMSNGDDGFSIL